VSGSRAARIARALLGGVWFAGWFFTAFPAALLWLCGASLIPPPGANRLLGAALIAAAHVVLVALVAQFLREGAGTQLPFDPPTRMVARGIYARIRNPMYATYIAIACGEAVLYRSAPLAAYALGFAALLHAYVVRFEEPRLRTRFGVAYERYCEATGRWWPRR
jgi:protein-S-isoprenylcysteine O-methyltransferase Ste14